MSATSNAQQQRVYICPDEHTDYFWTADDAQYRGAFIDMVDYYLNQMDLTAGNPPDFQSRWHCDGSHWMWEYERARTPAQFSRFINRVRTGHMSVAMNPLVVNPGGSATESVIRGMYYPGRIERRENLRFRLAISMENQTLPLGLPSLWAGCGASYSWKGVCACVSPVPGLQDREHEIYRAVGKDGRGILMKWNSLLFGTNESLGGYAEARFPGPIVDQLTTNAPFNGFAARWPYNVIGAFGKGWDDFTTFTDEFITVAQTKSNASRRVIVSDAINFFDDFAATYPNVPSKAVSFGNDWDTAAAATHEQAARIRRATEALRGAEALAAWVSLYEPSFMTGREGARDQAFQNMGLFYEHNMAMQFPPTGAEGVRKRMDWNRRLANEAEQYVTQLGTDARAAFGELVPLRTEMQRFFVMNPLSWSRTDVADFVVAPGGVFSVYEVQSGVEVPSQRIVTPEGVASVRILASDVPALGYKVYELRPVAGQTFNEAASVTGGTSGSATRTYTIADSTRDATSDVSTGSQRVWLNGYANGLEPHLFISTDADDQSSGVQFAIDLPATAQVQAATLRVRSSPASNPSPTGGILIEAYDNVNCPPFVQGQAGDLVQFQSRAAGGVIWPTNGWPASGAVSSPDIGSLVQAFVSRAGYTPGNHLGLVLSEGTMQPGRYVGFEDFSKPQGVPAALEVTFTDPSNPPSGQQLVIDNGVYRVTANGAGVLTSWLDLTGATPREMISQIAGRLCNDLGGNGGTIVVENAGPVSVTLRATASSPLARTTRITLFRSGSELARRIDVHNRIEQNFQATHTWNYSFQLSAPDLLHEELGAILLAKLRTQGGDYSERNARYDWLTLNHFALMREASGRGVTLSAADNMFMQRVGSSITTLDTQTPALAIVAGGQLGESSIPNQNGDTLFTQRFALRSDGNATTDASMRFSLEHQNPLQTGVVTGGVSAPLDEGQGSLLTLSNPGVVAWALKPAEDGPSAASGALTLRMWNVRDVATNVVVSGQGVALGNATTLTHLETPDPALDAPFVSQAEGVSGTFAPQQIRTIGLQATPIRVCDPIDFNRNGVFPEDHDVVDFFNTLAGAPCAGSAVCDIDFNNNGVFPEDQDVVDYLNVLAGGACP